MSHLMFDGKRLCSKPDNHGGSHLSIDAAEREKEAQRTRENKCKCESHTGDERWHGTTTGYGWHRCKCDRCTKANRDAVAAYHEAHPNYAKNHRDEYNTRPDRIKANRESLWRKGGIIGMTTNRFEKMMADQGGCCYLCGNDITGVSITKWGERLKAVVDHDHNITNRDNVRRLLCSLCNTRLGWFEDKMNKLADYLDIDISCMHLS